MNYMQFGVACTRAQRCIVPLYAAFHVQGPANVGYRRLSSFLYPLRLMIFPGLIDMPVENILLVAPTAVCTMILAKATCALTCVFPAPLLFHF